MSISKDIELAREAERSIIARIHRLASELQAEDPRLSFELCEARVWQQRPKLYQQLLAARRVLAAAGIRPIISVRSKR